MNAGKDRMALVFHPSEALEKVSDLERRYTGCTPAAPADEEHYLATASSIAQWSPKESWGGGLPDAREGSFHEQTLSIASQI